MLRGIGPLEKPSGTMKRRSDGLEPCCRLSREPVAFSEPRPSPLRDSFSVSKQYLPALCLTALACEPLAVGHIGPPPEPPGAHPSAPASPGGPAPPPGAPGQPITPATEAACKARLVPAQPLRRLSWEQYQNTLRDLFGAELAAPFVAGSPFPATAIKSGFAADAEANVVNSAHSNAIEDNADRIAAIIVMAPERYLRALLPCPLGTTITDAVIDGCTDAFITGFGQRAYRRPLTSREVAVIRRIYDQLRPAQGATRAWAALVQFFVEAPALLYRVERGAGPAPGLPGLVKLTDHEMATRLSYLFLGSLPDAPLFAAAAAGRLSTRAQIAEQTDRLLDSPRVAEALGTFHRDWLHLHELQAGKDPAVFPGYTPALQSSFAQEAQELARWRLAAGDLTIESLLGGATLVVDAPLAAHYGVTAPGATDTRWVPVTVPNRRGLLTQASFMAALAHPDRTSPIHRGAFFQQAVLCQPVPALPANVDTATPLEAAASRPTARERLAPLLTRGDCAGCHARINPTGLALENYDALGTWRDRENGALIDASGSIDLGEGPKPFDGPAALVHLLAASGQARDCYALQWFRAALGRLELPEDACSLAYLKQEVARSGGDLRALLRALTETDAFLYRAAGGRP